MAWRRRIRVGLLSRMVLALAATGLIPLAIVPYLIGVSRQAVTDQVLRTHAVAARSAAARVDALLGSLQQAAGSVALNPQVYTDPRETGAQELLAGLLQAQPLIVGAVVDNADGGEVLRVQNRARAEIVNAVLAAPSSRPIVPRREFGVLWLRLSSPLPDGRGSLRLVVDGSPVEDALENEELGREAVILLSTDQDEVVAASEEGATLQSFPATLVEAGRSRRTSGASRFADTGGDVLGAYAPISSAGWFVLSRQPARVAEEVAVEMNRRSAVAVLAALGLTAFLSAVAYRTFVRPVRELVEAQRRLGHGRPRGAHADELEQLRAGLAALERETMDRQAIGKVFLGRYMVMELVGSGGMGSVFRGWDPKLERQVALKTVHPAESVPDPERTARLSTLLHEAINLARISHPNIVGVYDVEDFADLAFIAMEFVEGVNLQMYLARFGRLGPDEAVPLGAAVAGALAAAHGHSIVHRDVKPGNVLLGVDGALKVTDFGIAGPVRTPSRDTGRSVFGTPGYLPPEALREGHQDMGGDLFALGSLLYECLAGRSPFAGPTIQDTLLRTQTLDPPSLRSRDGTMPAELDQLVMGLLVKDPALRQPTRAADVARQLEAIASGRGWRWQLRPLEDVRATVGIQPLSTGPHAPEPPAQDHS